MGFSQSLATGTNVAIDATMNRNSSNSNFSTLNPSWNGSIRYSFTQHLVRDYGRLNNTHLIRAARNNEKMSETQFERQLIDLVAQAQRTYWDLFFSAEDIKVKQRSVDLAAKTHSDNRIQVQIGTLAPIDIDQAESEVANRRVQFVTATFTEVQTQDEHTIMPGKIPNLIGFVFLCSWQLMSACGPPDASSHRCFLHTGRRLPRAGRCLNENVSAPWRQ